MPKMAIQFTEIDRTLLLM